MFTLVTPVSFKNLKLLFRSRGTGLPGLCVGAGGATGAQAGAGAVSQAFVPWGAVVWDVIQVVHGVLFPWSACGSLWVGLLSHKRVGTGGTRMTGDGGGVCRAVVFAYQ